MSNITIFPDTYKSDKPYFTDIQKIYHRIKSDKYKDLISQIRSIADKKQRDRKKALLPSILFAGTFLKRSNDAIQEHAGYICIDFDNLGQRKDTVHKLLIECPYTHLLFISPSGNGYKCVFRIPAVIGTHGDSARGIQAYFKNEPSYDHFADVARICYISHDPEIYYNPDSKVFTDMVEAPKSVVVEYTQIISDYDLVYTNLKTWLEKNKNEYYYDGNKHKYLVKLAGACNRFGIPKFTTIQKLTYDYQHAASPVNAADIEKIVAKVYANYGSQHATSFFDKTEKVYEKTPEAKYQRVENFELPDYEVAKDVIYIHHIREQILDIYEHGFKKAETTHYSEIDEHWKWKKGEINLMTGMMNHGKSTLILQLMLIKSMNDGTQWGIFSPEQNPPDEFYLDLAHTYLGKNTNRTFKNACSKEELNNALDFLENHFYFIYPEKDAPTPEYINERFLEVIVKHNVKGCLIDPFNQLDIDIKKTGGREDLYISAFGSTLKRFTLEHDLYMVVNAHPNSSVEKVKDKKADNYGNYVCPDVFDLSGGAMWGNKFDNILVTYRPYYSTDPTNTIVEFVSKKIKKQKLVGLPGTATLRFNRATNRFTDLQHRSPFPEPYNENDTIKTYNPYEFLKPETPAFEINSLPDSTFDEIQAPF